ncbi:MAG: molecular chaperone HtpG [Lachnospiraceae bacterium]|nr:molecular chaperone HtpG [Lachnospiraceae bacterium]
MAEKGSLSINSENMFPIIKKWLYSDHDIFYRELISNGCDAITKLGKLDMMGAFALPEDYKARIDIEVSPTDKTIKVSDNGIGMTADEVREYINNIAFSGAEAFLAKYKDKASSDQIIGHFGLGFYSAFMVADMVTIDTLSYQEGAEPVHWECDGSSTYSMDKGSRQSFGTTITLHLTEDCVEFANYYKAQEVIEKYCSFMPTEIYLSEKDTSATETIAESERRPDDVVIEVIEPEKKEDDKGPAEKRLKIRRRPVLLNNTHPLWGKNPSECTEEEYKEFYRNVFRDYKEPLFWIHLNMDYPYNLKGILYFPKLNLEYESAEGVIKLYNNQVFIADNIKEVIPEYLMLLKGVIDCPDLPLNVSRSALQNDGFAKKISDYITKKVADKLAGMCKTDKENYEKYWDDISPFIKYGCLRDDKFCARMTDYILFKDLDGNYLTTPEALKVNKVDPEAEEEEKSAQTATDENGEKVEAEVVGDGKKAGDEADKEEEKVEDHTIYYVTDPQQQSQYIRMFRDNKMQAFILDHTIDQPFIQQLEAKNEGLHFARIDADVQEALKTRTGKKAAEALKESSEKLEKMIRKEVGNDKLSVKLENLRDKKTASMLTVNEQSRRMADMMKMYAASGMSMGLDEFAKEGQTLILNAKHPLVKYIMEHEEDKLTGLICRQLYDLAQIQNAPLSPEDMAGFVARSNEIMMMLMKEEKEEKEKKEE